MISKMQVVIIILLIAVIFVLWYLSKSRESTSTDSTNIRKAFSDHAIWTKLYIDAATNNFADSHTKSIVNRLMQNQHDIGNLIRPVVGDDKADKLTELLVQHIEAAANTTNAAVSGQKEALQMAIQNQMDNSDKVARMLTILNPQKLPANSTIPMFRQHNQYVIDQVHASLAQDWAQTVKIFDEYYLQILAMADAIAVALQQN